MPGRAVGVETTYVCEVCGQPFTVYQDVSSGALHIVIDRFEEHEDCEAE
jgi:hypothetical protein